MSARLQAGWGWSLMAFLLCRGLSALAKPAGDKGCVALAAAVLLYPWRHSSQPQPVSGRRL